MSHAGSRILRRAAIAAMVLVLCGVGGRPAAAQFSNTQKVFAPLMLALGIAYNDWLSGPLGGTAPSSQAFTATLNATSDPYTVKFAATAGHSLPGASYSIPSSTVLDSSWPAVPSSNMYPQGPVTLSGTFVLAYLAARHVQATLKEQYGGAYAYENAPGGGLVISNVTTNNGQAQVLVGFYQYFVQLNTHYVGCYKEQHYFVDPSTFVAQQTNVGCPGVTALH